MKKIIGYSIVSLMTVTTIVFAQNKENKKKVFKPQATTYLAGGERGDGNISEKLFDSLITLPLVAKDSMQNEYPVFSYFFTYVERGLYEDSTGRLMVHADYLSAHSENGLLPETFRNYVLEKSKPGDTAFISNVIFKLEDSVKTSVFSNSIKLILIP